MAGRLLSVGALRVAGATGWVATKDVRAGSAEFAGDVVEDVLDKAVDDVAAIAADDPAAAATADVAATVRAVLAGAECAFLPDFLLEFLAACLPAGLAECLPDALFDALVECLPAGLEAVLALCWVAAATGVAGKASKPPRHRANNSANARFKADSGATKPGRSGV